LAKPEEFMKRILIVVGITLFLGVAGFLAVPEIATRHQDAVAQPAPTGDPNRDLANSIKYMNQSAGDMVEWQHWATIGGGVGSVCGLFLGVAIASLLARKTK
jgi:hypothetical protein